MQLKSRTALLLAGALAAYITPKLAADAKLDLQPILGDVTRENVKSRRSDLALAVKKIAKDADIEGVLNLIDAVASVDDGPDKLAEEAPAADDEGGAGDLCAKITAALAGKVDDATLQQIVALCGGGATDEDVEGGNGPPPVAGDPKDKPMDKAAMDAALLKVQSDTVARMNAIREAEDLCQPIIGKLKVAQDSAAAVYKLALDAKKIDVKGVDPSAYRVLVVQALNADTGDIRPATKIAQDAAGAADWFKEQFPTAKIV